MAEQRACFAVTMVVVIVASLSYGSAALRSTVGDTSWSIPPFPTFYRIWSSLHFFQTGDSIMFDFETGYYNVVQVSREEYGRCSSDNPLEVLNYGPATVLLSQVGVFYYICNISDYCRLGQKISIIVHENRFHSPVVPPPSSGGSNCSQSPTGQISPAPEPVEEQEAGTEPPTRPQHSSGSSLGFGWAPMICMVGLFCLLI